MEHKMIRFAKTPVAIIDGEEVPDPFREEQVVYGCETCDMGAEEASQSPCPGHPISEILD